MGRDAVWKVAILFLPLVGFGASSLTISKDASGSVTQGDLAYSRANFEQAESLYRQALSIDPKCSRALLGLGRIEHLHFRRGAARDYFAEAYKLDPRDPLIVRSYVAAMTDRDAQTALLKSYIESGVTDRADLAMALGRIQMNQQLGARETGVLESPYRPYVLPMKSYCPTVRCSGALLSVSINDAKPLRLIVDTGADGIVIRAKAAEKLGLEYLGSKEFRGLGGNESVNGRIGLARSVAIGDLRLANCFVDVSDSLPSEDADGVIGTALFQRFLIRFAAAQGRLELLPLPEQPEGDSKAVRVGHLLLVETKIDGASGGRFLLATGAAYSLLSRNLVLPGQIVSGAAFGVGGRLEGVRTNTIRFQFGREPLVDPETLVCDLRPLSLQTGVEIAGLIGYRALSHKVLTINYRDGLIDIGR